MSNILVCNICTEIWGAEESTESNSQFIRHCAGRFSDLKPLKINITTTQKHKPNGLLMNDERQDLKFLFYNCRNSFNVFHCVTAVLDWKDENTQSLDNKFIL